MRFLSVIKAEDQGPPPQALMDAMGKLIENSFRSGLLVDTGGLAPLAEAIRVQTGGGKVSIVDGPYSETKELIGGYAILECGSKEEALQVAKDFLDLHVKHWPEWRGMCEVRQIFGPND